MNTSDLKSPLSSQLDELESLLAKQVRLAQQGNLHGHEIEALSRQAAGLVDQIAANGTLGSPELEQKRGRLASLYGELCISLRVQMAEVQTDVSRIRKGLKALRTYRNSV